MRKLQQFGTPGAGEAGLRQWLTRVIGEIMRSSNEPTPGVDTDGDFDGVGIAADLALSGVLTPSQITANQNNYDPDGIVESAVLRLASDASRNITGVMAPGDLARLGKVLILWNIGAQDIVLIDESASSTAANRFSLTGDLTLTADQSIALWYDEDSSRWRALAPPATGLTAGVDYLTPSAIAAAYQPLDGDLTSIAALTTTAYGRSLLEVASLAALLNTTLTTRGDVLRRGSTTSERLALGATNTILNSDGTDAGWRTLTVLLDAIFGSTRGMMLRRGASAWEAFALGTSGYVLTAGASDPAWAALSAQPVPTAYNGFGVGCYAYLEYTSTATNNNGDTTTNVKHLIFNNSTGAYGDPNWGAGGAPGGTWMNISGATMDTNGSGNNAAGAYVRTA